MRRYVRVPYLVNQAVTKASATEVASFFGVGKQSMNLVKQSVLTRIY